MIQVLVLPLARRQRLKVDIYLPNANTEHGHGEDLFMEG